MRIVATTSLDRSASLLSPWGPALVVVCALSLSTCGKSSSSPTPTAPTTVAETTIGGRVTAAAGGAAIAGVTVDVVTPATESGVRGLTDGDGRYRLTGIRSTTFTVRYVADGFVTGTREFTFTLGTERSDLDTTLQKPTTIGGRVADVFGVPIAGARVEIISPSADAGIRATTDDNGRYRLTGIQSTSLVVQYTRENYQTGNREYSFGLGTERTDLDTRLASTIDRVRLVSLDPPSGATLAASLTPNLAGHFGVIAVVEYTLVSRDSAFLCAGAALASGDLAGGVCAPAALTRGSRTAFSEFTVLANTGRGPLTTTQVQIRMGTTARFVETFLTMAAPATFTWNRP